jgi:hypothetical protein
MRKPACFWGNKMAGVGPTSAKGRSSRLPLAVSAARRKETLPPVRLPDWVIYSWPLARVVCGRKDFLALGQERSPDGRFPPALPVGYFTQNARISLPTAASYWERRRTINRQVYGILSARASTAPGHYAAGGGNSSGHRLPWHRAA